MRHDQTTQLARTPLLLIDYAVHHGMDRGELMRQADLGEADLEDPDSRVATRSMRNLWRAVIEQQGDPDLGLHIGFSINAVQLGLVGYAMSYSSNLGDALQRLARYGKILSDSVQYRLRRTGDSVVFTEQAHPSLVALRHPIVAGMSVVLAIAREVTQTELIPLNAELPFPNPGTPGVLPSAYGCDVLFDRPVSAITFSAEQMELPNRYADPTLSGYLDDLAAFKLGDLDDRTSSLVFQVRQTLWSMLPGGRPDLWRTAKDMGMSARTLQRRLGEEGTSFSRVLDELRRDVSDELLADRQMAVSEVAFLLGYSEPSAFQRAFRRWRGVSPRRYRTGSDG